MGHRVELEDWEIQELKAIALAARARREELERLMGECVDIHLFSGMEAPRPGLLAVLPVP